MPTIEELIDRHGEETVQKAFWLQEHIKEEGIEAANFSEAAEQKMEIMGPMNVKNSIENNTLRSL